MSRFKRWLRNLFKRKGIGEPVRKAKRVERESQKLHLMLDSVNGVLDRARPEEILDNWAECEEG
jgi:hypothetical protein